MCGAEQKNNPDAALNGLDYVHASVALYTPKILPFFMNHPRS